MPIIEGSVSARMRTFSDRKMEFSGFHIRPVPSFSFQTFSLNEEKKKKTFDNDTENGSCKRRRRKRKYLKNISQFDINIIAKCSHFDIFSDVDKTLDTLFFLAMS